MSRETARSVVFSAHAEVVPIVAEMDLWFDKVFSAHAEVVPAACRVLPMRICILRARGGSSSQASLDAIKGLYSPRTRR